MASNVETNKQMMQDFINALMAGNVAAAAELVHEDGALEIMGDTMISGRIAQKDMLSHFDALGEFFANGLKLVLYDMVGEGDSLAVEMESWATLKSGKIYNNKYHSKVTFRDGKILLMREYMDTEHVTDFLFEGEKPARGTNILNAAQQVG